MGDGVDRPRHARRAGERTPAGRLGLAVASRFLEAERVQRQHIGMQRVVVGPRRQHRLDVPEQLPRVAAVEVEQLQPLQGERVARVSTQDIFPALACADPVARREAPQRGEVVALALVAVIA